MEPGPGSNPSDNQHAAALEDHADDPAVEELTPLIDSLSEDEQIDLVAPAWLGRDEAARAHNRRTSSDLLGMPLLGRSWEEFEIGRL